MLAELQWQETSWLTVEDQELDCVNHSSQMRDSSYQGHRPTLSWEHKNLVQQLAPECREK